MPKPIKSMKTVRNMTNSEGFLMNQAAKLLSTLGRAVTAARFQTDMRTRRVYGFRWVSQGRRGSDRFSKTSLGEGPADDEDRRPMEARRIDAGSRCEMG